MVTNKKKDRVTLEFKETISSYAASKVVDWVLKNKVDQGVSAHFKWTDDDKVLIKKTLFDKKSLQNGLPIDDAQYAQFFQSVIDNGLNTDDVKLFQLYKNRLPLRALGLAYDLLDFKCSGEGLISRNEIELGYYMLEISIAPKIYSSQLPLVLSSLDHENGEANKFLLHCQSDRIAKRLIKLDANSLVSVHSDSTWVSNDITHFKLAKLTKNFFLSRLYKKLGKPFSVDNVTSVTDAEFNSLWLQYDSIFSYNRRNNGIDKNRSMAPYGDAVKISPSQQIKNLIKAFLK